MACYRPLKRNVTFFHFPPPQISLIPLPCGLALDLVTAEATNVSAICVGANSLVIV